jgi:hypothetical protein
VGEEPPSIDQNSELQGVFFHTKIRIEATVERELYQIIQGIIEEERRAAEAKDYPDIPISNVVEMILRKGVRAYQQEKRGQREKESQK